MDPETRSSARWTIACGLVAALIGLFYVLQGAGFVEVTVRPKETSPGWLAIVIGLIFMSGGGAVIIQTVFKGGNPSDAGLPATAPLGFRLIQNTLVFMIVAGLGIVSSWVAFGPGPRQFTGSGAVFGETGGRIAFGIGASIIWIVLLAIGIGLARQVCARK